MFLGLMSGTSVDGLDVALVDEQLHLVIAQTYAYPAALRQALATLGAATRLRSVIERERDFTQFCAESVMSCLQAGHVAAGDITSIGFHGHTAWHSNAPAMTFQIGDASWLAAHTGIPVVADFRRKDISVGGHGAPLAPLFHQQLLTDHTGRIGIINVGGIANITVIDRPSGALLAAYDTGPGNTLMDFWCQKHRGVDFDANGSWAAQGQANAALVQRLMSDPYFAAPAPKSTGKEYFCPDWLQRHLDATRDCASDDIQASLLECTALSIAAAIRTNRIDRAYVCGGGAHNQALMQRIGSLSGVPTSSTEALGVDPDWVEAIAFAWLAKQRYREAPLDCRRITGATRATTLGGLFLP